jgi:hypothetical protein
MFVLPHIITLLLPVRPIFNLPLNLLKLPFRYFLLEKFISLPQYDKDSRILILQVKLLNIIRIAQVIAPWKVKIMRYTS